MSGWTQYDKKRTSWGSWSGWSTTDPTNGTRNVDSRSVYDHTEYHYYRWIKYNSNGSTYGVWDYKESGTVLEEKWFNYELPKSSYGSGLVYYGTDNWANRWVPANSVDNHTTDKTFTKTVNRTEYRYQEPVYTYYFERQVSKEATSDPTGQTGVSNVVKYVQYREK